MNVFVVAADLARIAVDECRDKAGRSWGQVERDLEEKLRAALEREDAHV